MQLLRIREVTIEIISMEVTLPGSHRSTCYLLSDAGCKILAELTDHSFVFCNQNSITSNKHKVNPLSPPEVLCKPSNIFSGILSGKIPGKIFEAWISPLIS